MHCPSCGQQQISDETKFCSRCGFQLGLVAELLANGGYLPQLAALYSKDPSFFTRKNGVIFSILWFILFVMMLPAFFGIADADELAGISALFGVFTTIMLLIVSLGFLKKGLQSFQRPAVETGSAIPTSLHGRENVGALPPQQSQPVSSYVPPEGSWRAADTGDLARPASVTERTTKLLKKEDNP